MRFSKASGFASGDSHIHPLNNARAENPRRYPVLFDDCKAVEGFAIIDQRALRSGFGFYQNSITVECVVLCVFHHHQNGFVHGAVVFFRLHSRTVI